MEDLEARITEFDRELAAPAPSPVRLHPNLADLYRRKVTELALTLADPAIALPARETIRGLIEAVTVSFDGNQPVVALDGALASLISLAQNDKSPGGAGLDAEVLSRSAKVVAGARNRRRLLKPRCMA